MPVTADPEAMGLDAERLSRISDWMERQVESGRLPCAMTLVARHGQVVYLDGVGMRDVEAGLPVAEDTVFRIYSMTKPITVAAALMLYEEGLFQLDDPIGAYLPELAEMEVLTADGGREKAASPITIQQLMSHTSGLTYAFSDPGPVGDAYRAAKIDFSNGAVSSEEMVKRLAGVPLKFHPGTKWNYGVSTDVVGRLVEVLSGQSLGDFMAKRIFAPLGMSETGFRVRENQIPRFAALYGPKDGGIELIDETANSRFVAKGKMQSGGGGLVSTIGDYFRFTEMLRGMGRFEEGRLLGRKTVEFMTMNHLPGDLAEMGQPVFSETSFAGVGFGLGVSVMLDPAKAGVMGTPGEYAWGGAASTAFWIDPDEDLTVIFMTQLMPSSTYPLRRQLRVLTYQALVEEDLDGLLAEALLGDGLDDALLEDDDDEDEEEWR